MRKPEWALRLLSRWSTYAVLTHLILAQSDSSTRGFSADGLPLYGCTELSCTLESAPKAGNRFPYCPKHGWMTRRIMDLSPESETPDGSDGAGQV